MLQIATFAIPAEQEKANEFLRTHKPEGEIARMGDVLFIAYETGEYSADYEIADLQALLRGAKQTRIQHEIALEVLKEDRDKLNAKSNKSQWDELTDAITGMLRTMKTQEIKAAVVEQRIKTLQSSNGGTNITTGDGFKAAGKKAKAGK
jgi:hypothetical protein